MKTLLVLTTATICLLAIGNFARAGSFEKKGGLSLQVGFYSPAMKQSGTTSMPGANIDFSDDWDCGSALTVGLGIVTRHPSGAASRVSYQYKMVGEATSENPIYASQGLEAPYFRYSIHSLAFALMRHFSLVPQTFSLYIGGGGAVMVTYYPDAASEDRILLGGSLYPLGGVELGLSSHFGFFGEFQYHFGRTLDKEFTLAAYSVTTKYHYDLSGPMVLAGVNWYF